MPYPYWAAGEIITADKLTARQVQVLVKAAAQSVTSSTTLVNDDTLFAAVDADAVYEVELALGVTGSTAGDIRVAWSTPTGSATGARLVQGPATGMTDPTSTSMRSTRHNWTTSVTYGTATTAGSICEYGILTTGATPGVLQLQWAQQTSSATATTVGANSYLTVRRVA